MSVLLDAFRPLAFVGGQALWIAQPMLSLLVDKERIADIARLLEEPEALDTLRTLLEEG